jgi:hypothetical protein
MSLFHSTILPESPATVPQTTRVVDTLKVVSGSFAANLAAPTGSVSVVVALEGSNAVPPNGATPNQPSRAGVNESWAPPESSWQPLKDAAGAAVSVTMTTAGTKLLLAPADTLLCRWARVKATPTGLTGGTIEVEAFLRDAGV